MTGVVAIEDPAERSRICEAVLRSLPEWAAEEHLRRRGVEYLQDERYARTRAFYEAAGFVPLEELRKLWGHNPALVLVKRL